MSDSTRVDTGTRTGHRRPRAAGLAAPVLLAVLLAAPVGAGVTAATGRSGAGRTETPHDVVVTALPDRQPAAAEPALPGLRTAAAPAGTVARVAGPFDDRFRLTGLRLGRTGVSGDLDVTSDVSDLLELQVVAGFYDGRGRLLGSGRFTRHEDPHGEQVSGTPDERVALRIAVPAPLRGRVVSAAVGVPVLVNE